MRAVFLDRDGVINEPANVGDYVRCWSEFRFLPNIVRPLRVLIQEGYKLIIVTNQQGVGKGLVSLEALAEIHFNMLSVLRSCGVVVDRVYTCPHLIAENCGCRKPKPGMLLQAAKRYGISLEDSYMIGDSVSDIEAGEAAGCRTVLIGADGVWNLRQAVEVILHEK